LSTIAKFRIELHVKDFELLNSIRSYFNDIGQLEVISTRKLAYFEVTKLNDLVNIVIPHFDKYPLLTQTRADFELFKKFIDIMSREGHKTIEGLQQIVNIKATINKGLSDNLKINFPNTIPVLRPLVEEIQIFEPN